MSRKLASIQKIISIEPIDNAENIEKATILGWSIVVKKDEFNVGDYVVYCEVDSILPDKPEYEFLRPRNFRIRTIRLRGQVSQGLVLPISVLPDETDIIEDSDVTEIVGIIKWEPTMPAALSGIAKGNFPSFIPKTDETRCQVLQKLLNTHQGIRCYITEKLDGSSVTYYLNNGEFGVCSRNLDLKESEENSFWRIAKELAIQEKLISTGGNYAIQGELVGPGVQGNKLKLEKLTAKFFNVWDIDKQKYLNFIDFVEFFSRIDLDTVPILTDNYILENNIQRLVDMSIIKSALYPSVWAEGIIIRSFDDSPIYSERFSFKSINPEFLLKFSE